MSLFRQPASAVLAATTTMPFHGDGGAIVIVDDENVRLTAALELGGRRPDYTALQRRCASAFGGAAVHVFTVRHPDGLGLDRRGPVHLHVKQVPGKNTDVEAAIWLTQQLARHGDAADNLLLVSGDVDYLAMYSLACDLGVRAGFVAPPGRSLATALRQVPLGLLGRDVLVESHRPLRLDHRSVPLAHP